MDSKFNLIVSSFGKDKFKFNEPIKNYTVLGIGGPAKIFFIAFTVEELVKIITMCRDLHLPFFLFGTGSKIMISDQGFEGLVIKNRTKNIKTISVKGKASRLGIGVEEVLIEADSGISMHKFAMELERQNLSSEGFKATGGSIGGSLFINAFLQTITKSIKVLNQNNHLEDIDSSILNLKKHIVLSAIFTIKAKL